MKIRYLLTAVLLAGLFAVPASAFTIDAVDITIGSSGDADITAQYSLTWAEKMAAFCGIVNPADELRNALENLAPGKTSLKNLNDTAVSLSLSGFVKVNGTTYTTPAINLTNAEEHLAAYVKNQLRYDWLIGMVTSTNLAPAVTTITFPDGYKETYSDVLVFPSVTHTCAV